MSEEGPFAEAPAALATQGREDYLQRLRTEIPLDPQLMQHVREPTSLAEADEPAYDCTSRRVRRATRVWRHPATSYQATKRAGKALEERKGSI